MSTIPTITEQAIRELVGEASFERAQRYYNNDAIYNPRKQGMTLKARCEGSQSDAYHVQVTFNKTVVEETVCTCPLGSYCKHVGALLLTWLHRPEDFVEQEEIDHLLAAYDKPQLIALIKQMIRREPDLENLLPRTTEVGKPLNLTSYRRQMEAAFRHGGSDWGAAETISDKLSDLIETADGLVTQKDYANAINLYDMVASGTMDEEAVNDDQDGYFNGIIQDCLDGLERCLLPVQDNRVLHEKILDVLFRITRFDMQLGGIGFGEEAPGLLTANVMDEERETVAQWIRDTIATTSSKWTKKYMGGLLLELEKNELDDEAYLKIARSAGRVHDVVERLLTLGRVDEAVKETSGVSDYTLIEIADLFKQHDQGSTALRLMEERAKKTTDMRVLEWLKKQYLRNNNLAAALKMARTLFFEQYKLFLYQANLSRYREIRQLAGSLGQWQEVRAEILAFLDKHQNFTLLIYIALDEGEIENAIALVNSNELQIFGVLQAYGSVYLNPIGLEVAKAAEESRPQAAMQIYEKYVDRLVAKHGRTNYQTAIEHLQKMRALYVQQGKEEQWKRYIVQLRDKNKGLRAFREALENAHML